MSEQLSSNLNYDHKPKTLEELNHSRLFDVHRVSEHEGFRRVFDSLWDEFFKDHFPTSGRGNKPKKPLKEQCKALILDLYVGWKTDPTLLTAFSLSVGAFKASSRYNELHLSKKLRELVKLAIHFKLIDYQLGSEASRMVTRIWPTDKLVKHFQRVGMELSELAYNDQQEVVYLSKAKDSGDYEADDLSIDSSDETKERKSLLKAFDYVEYDDLASPSDIPRWRDVLHRYNKLLERTYIDIGSLETPFVTTTYWDRRFKEERARAVFVGQHNKYVKRIFYRADWNLGGRIHGGWWQQVKSNYRKDILINNEITLEQDFKGLHVTLLYGLKGLQPPEDPYITDLECPFSSDDARKLTKGLVLNAINAKDEKSAFQAFRNEQKAGSDFKSIKDTALRKVIDAFIEANPEIEGDLFGDKGVELMAIDGRITFDIIEYFTNKGIPVLSVHDSYITTEEHSSKLYQRMRFAIMSEMAPYNPNQDHLAKLSSGLNLPDDINVRLGLLDFDAKIERELNSIAYVETWKAGMKWADLQTKADAEWDNRACNSYGQRYRKWKQSMHG